MPLRSILAFASSRSAIPGPERLSIRTAIDAAGGAAWSWKRCARIRISPITNSAAKATRRKVRSVSERRNRRAGCRLSSPKKARAKMLGPILRRTAVVNGSCPSLEIESVAEYFVGGIELVGADVRVGTDDSRIAGAALIVVQAAG